MIDEVFWVGFLGGITGGFFTTLLLTILIYSKIKRKLNDSPIGEMFL